MFQKLSFIIFQQKGAVVLAFDTIVERERGKKKKEKRSTPKQSQNKGDKVEQRLEHGVS